MKLTDATLLTSIVTGGLYFSGYIFNLHYLDYFSAPPALFNEDVASSILLGWGAIYERGLWLFCIFGLYFLSKVFLFKNISVPEEFKKLADSLVMKLIVIIVIAFTLYMNASNLGRVYAKEQFSLMPLTSFIFKNEKYNGDYRVIAFNKGNYLLLGSNKKLIVISQQKVNAIHFRSNNYKYGDEG